MPSRWIARPVEGPGLRSERNSTKLLNTLNPPSQALRLVPATEIYRNDDDGDDGDDEDDHDGGDEDGDADDEVGNFTDHEDALQR